LFLGAAVLVVLLVTPSLDGQTFVPRLTFDNPTEFDVNVEVAGGGREAWIDLGTVARGTENVVEEVADPGGTWVFRFSYAGVDAGIVTMDRGALRDAGWQLAVPAEVGESLVGAGFVPSAG